MAESSYYPLVPLKSPLDSGAPPSPPSFKNESDPLHIAETSGLEDWSGSHSTMFLAPLRPQLFRKRLLPGRRPAWRVIRTRIEMALLPLAAIAYLAFCYTVHGTVVPVNTYGLYAVTPEHLATIKGGITTISIIVISIALYPVYTVVSDLKSEEFFRVLTHHVQGVPLETINLISNPSFGNIDKLMAVWRHSCSNYYILGIITSLLIWVVTTLAPGALTIDNVLYDGELMAFAIGAVTLQSVLNGTSPAEPAFNASLNAVAAAQVTWAEMELGVQYSFGIASTEPDYKAFITPVPLDLPTTTSARWLTDVIGINPTCSWASTNLTVVQLPFNSTNDFYQHFATAYLPDFNLDIKLTSADIPGIGNTPFAFIKDPLYYVTNHTTRVPASDGSTVFLLGQCQSGCLPGQPVDVTLNLTGINTSFTISLTDQTWIMAILACNPNATIETREVRNNGHGILTVQPRSAGKQLMRQGNLNPGQTRALFSIATMELTQSAGPLYGNRIQYSQLGGQVQGDVLYGKAQFDGLPGDNSLYGTTATLTPAPIENITQGYTQVIQSSAKSYLAGYLGTAYVPGRISSNEMVFAASIPNLAISSAVFALLIALIIFVHFRPGKGVEFSLVNIAAAVHGSELPAQFAQINAEQTACMEAEGDTEANDAVGKGKGRMLGGASAVDLQDLADMLGERRIFMQRRADGSPVLHLT